MGEDELPAPVLFHLEEEGKRDGCLGCFIVCVFGGVVAFDFADQTVALAPPRPDEATVGGTEGKGIEVFALHCSGWIIRRCDISMVPTTMLQRKMTVQNL